MTQAAQTVNISLPVDAINVVLASLAKQPFEAVADLITAIRSQAIEQLQTTDQAIQQLPTAEESK